MHNLKRVCEFRSRRTMWIIRRWCWPTICSAAPSRRAFPTAFAIEGLSYSVSTSFTAPSEGNAALFSMAAISNPANTPKVEASFLDELRKAVQGGFTAQEVAAAKKAYRDAQMVSRSQDSALLTLIASREQAGRTLQWDEQIDAKIQALSPEQISAAFRKHLDTSAISVVKAGDFKAAKVYQ